MRSGQFLLHYKILDRLGEGGMGEVYRAEDTRLGRIVALKVLRSDLAGDEEWSRRFEREIRVASSFSHPGIATLYDVHRDGSTVFFTMEFVEGRTLRQALAEGPLPSPILLRCAVQMAEALAEAHRKGIIHRDLKPENVIESSSGYFKILDFGLARFTPERLLQAGGGSRLETVSRDTTQAGKLVGTVSYMSPEQAQGAPVDARSDIFSFGSVLYELAAGRAPFRRHTAIATFHAIVHEEASPIGEIRRDLPQEFTWIVARCLAKDPADRYGDGADLAQDLRALASQSESSARRSARIRPYPGTAASWRRMIAVGAAAVAIAALGAVAAWIWLPSAGDRSRREPASAAAPVPAASAEDARRTIVVSPFTNNTGDPSADWLIQGVPEMLTSSLAGLGSLKVISTQRLNDLLAEAGGSGAGGLDGAKPGDLARWAGAGIVVSGSIYRMGKDYRISAQAYDTETGKVLAASMLDGSDLFRLVDRLTEELRTNLRLAAGEERRIVATTTSSEEAFRNYAEGLRLGENLRFEEGAEALRKSVEADPNFALAQMRLGMNLLLAGRTDEGLRSIDRASDQAALIPDRERRLLEIITLYFKTGDTRAAEERVKAFARTYPEDQEASVWDALGRADVARDRLGAIRTLHKVVQQDAGNLLAASLLSRQLALIGRSEDAVRILSDYLERHPFAAGPLEQLIEGYRAAGPDAAAPAPGAEK